MSDPTSSDTHVNVPLGSERDKRRKKIRGALLKMAEVPAGTIAKVDTEKRQVFGWAYKSHAPDGTIYIDKQGDFIDDIEELEKAAYDFVLRSRRGDEMHLAVPKADMIESMVFTPEKVAKMGLPQGVLPTGWWIGFVVNDQAAWGRVRSGHYTQFSIGGRGTREAVED